MSVVFVKGDLFNTPNLKALAHGCNCKGAMGKGIAVEFKNRFPEMYKEYKSLCTIGDFVLGSVFIYRADPFIIFNLGTQQSWRTKAELPAIRESLKKMLSAAEQYGIAEIGLPRIGAGLGGLNWGDVKEVIEDVCELSKINIVVFEEYQPS
ncbi:phosphatase [Chitinophaga caeni]|uniref:Phosphatase n=1 Tax=Chitinophaga caeni TaxID=2029983 RepID=A0A291QW90_9BACT|nr:macro domain-containing protein [Chitinophaga caeni]ATL48191.1 phosphatase [Chitinophaga caeni]